MKVPACNISIGNLTFTWVNNVEIDTSWKNFTQTATITLPSKIKVNHNELASQISVGNEVVIEIGYEGNLNIVYKGYVTDISPRVPIVIKCEDEMWQVKQMNINDSGKNMSLKPLLSKLLPQYEINCLDIELGNYYIDNLSGTGFFKKLKSDFGLYAYFKNGTLTVGKIYDSELANRVKFKMESDDANVTKDDLIYKRKEDVRIKVEAISNNKDGSKIKEELGDSDGDKRTLNFYNLSKSELKEAAIREMERLKYDGWRGSFKAMGEPYTRLGDIVELALGQKSDKAGKYFVDAVKYNFGIDGHQQTITLGPRA